MSAIVDYAQPSLSITVCRTCPRPSSPIATQRREGASLSDRLARELGDLVGDQSDILIRRVECLSSCLHPVAVSLRTRGGRCVRMQGLPQDGGRHVLEAARAMLAESADG